MPTGPSFHPASYALQELLTLANEVERELARLLGVNLTDYRALTVLATSGPLTVSGLAEKLGATTATTTAALNRLEGKEYVRRERADGDRRRVLVRPTALVGEQIMRLMGPLMTEADERVSALSAEQRSTVEAFLGETNGLLRAHLTRLAQR